MAAASIVLKATDLPGSWKRGAVPAEDTSGDAQMAHCLGILNNDAEQTAYVGSPVFSQGPTAISSKTYAYTSRAVVQSDLRGITEPQLASCLTNLFTSQGAFHVHITKLPLPTTAGSLSGFQLAGSFDPPSSSGVGHLVFDEVGLAKGRIEMDINAETPSSTLPAGLIDQATAALAARLGTTTT